MSGRLDGLAVVVTRPAHQAEELCRLIESEGGRAVRFPALAIAGPADPEAARARLGGPAADWTVFVSPNAVEWAATLVPDLAQYLSASRLAAVGGGTARAMERALGRTPDLLPAGRADSEGLLAMSELQRPIGRVLIVRGEGGREHLAEGLRERGAEVAYAEVYRRALPAGDAAALVGEGRRGGLDVVTVTSGEGLENLCRLVDAAGGADWLRRMPLVVVAERTAERARQLGFESPPILAQPGDQGTLQALRAWAGTRENRP